MGRAEIFLEHIGNSAMGRNEKIAPPSLFKTTITIGLGDLASMLKEFKSCRNAKSPIKSVVGLFNPMENPQALAMMPSIPLAPRLAPIVTAGPSLEAYISISRMGILFDKKSPESFGMYFEINRATSGSLKEFSFCENLFNVF